MFEIGLDLNCELIHALNVWLRFKSVTFGIYLSVLKKIQEVHLNIICIYILIIVNWN